MDKGSFETKLYCQCCGKFLLKTDDLGYDEIVRVWCERCAVGARKMEISFPVEIGEPGWRCVKCGMAWTGSVNGHPCGPQNAKFERQYRTIYRKHVYS